MVVISQSYLSHSLVRKKYIKIWISSRDVLKFGNKTENTYKITVQGQFSYFLIYYVKLTGGSFKYLETNLSGLVIWL